MIYEYICISECTECIHYSLYYFYPADGAMLYLIKFKRECVLRWFGLFDHKWTDLGQNKSRSSLVADCLIFSEAALSFI